MSDADLEAALEKQNLDDPTTQAAMTAYQGARITGLKAALAVLALLALVALFFAQLIPRTQPGRGPPVSA